MTYTAFLTTLQDAEKSGGSTKFPIPTGTVVCELWSPICMTVLVAGKPICGLAGEENRQEFIWLGVFHVDDGRDISADETKGDDPDADDVWLVSRSDYDFVLTTTAAQLFAPLMDEHGRFKDVPPRWAKRLAAVLPYIDASMGGKAPDWAIRDPDLERICVTTFPPSGRG